MSNSDMFTRRILTFPAVRPCYSVSPTILLFSLINLAHTICNYKSKNFFTNGRNAKDSIRISRNLLIILEDIRNGCPELSDSAVLSLSELHFTFQKVQFLLEDCAREDARIWMLTKCEEVSNQFRELIRAIAVALDVLTLEPIQVSDEVRELVAFVRRQALKGNFEVESNDAFASGKVFSILREFEDEIVPEVSDVKWILDYMGIRSWSECSEEAKFLETEIELEWMTVEKRDMGLLSNLMGFLIYCRCIVFGVLDSQGTQKSDGNLSNEVVRCLNPDDLRCPISLDIMTDPVTILTGHTYDRSSILEWFRTGKPTCPKTGEKLICMDLVPNLSLKQLIKQYCSANGIPLADSGCHNRNRDITRTIQLGSAAAEQAVKMVAKFLSNRLASGPSSQEQNKAAYEIRLLSKAGIFNRSCLVEAGAIPPLLNLLSSRDSSTQENAIAALLNLSKHSKSRRVMVENGGLVLILDVLKGGLKMEARQHAAGTLFYLASVEEYRIMIGEIPEVFKSLMELVKAGPDRGKKNALVAIIDLLRWPDNHWRVLSAGLVPLVVNIAASSEREDLVTDSLAVLATLAENLDGAMAVLHAGALPLSVRVLSSSTSRATTEFAVSLLLAVCLNVGADVIRVLVKNPCLMGTLYSLLTDGTSRAADNALSLIRILQEFNEKTPSVLMAPAFQQEYFIPVW